MKVVVVKDYQEMSKRAAKMVASQVMLKPKSVLGLATGSTPEGMYKELINIYKENDLDFSDITTFNLDEYCGMEKENPQSYHYYMIENLFNNININHENIYIPNGIAEDTVKECSDYDELIENKGGIDLQILGIGSNAHIGFNEPDINFQVGTHVVELDESTIKANARFFESIEKVPKKAMSMGMKTIMQSRQIVLLASGLVKAEAIKNAIEGKLIPDVPGSILQLHPNVTVIVDEEAASMLTKKR